MFQTKVVEKIKTRILCSVIFLIKSCRLSDNVDKCGRVGQGTDEVIKRRMRLARRITNATDMHSEYVIIIVLSRQLQLRERASMLCLFVHHLSC